MKHYIIKQPYVEKIQYSRKAKPVLNQSLFQGHGGASNLATPILEDEMRELTWLSSNLSKPNLAWPNPSLRTLLPYVTGLFSGFFGGGPSSRDFLVLLILGNFRWSD